MRMRNIDNYHIFNKNKKVFIDHFTYKEIISSKFLVICIKVVYSKKKNSFSQTTFVLRFPSIEIKISNKYRGKIEIA